MAPKTFTHLFIGLTTLLLTITLSIPLALADWHTDVGYDSLVEELGNALPDGTGLFVCHAEAAVNVNDESTWMADPNNTAFSGKTLTDLSGAPAGVYSSHATSVGKLLYGNTSSMAPGVTDIDIYEAIHWIGSGYLRNGYSSQPIAASYRLANHSWVCTMWGGHAETSHLLRRLDWAVDRDEYIQTVGLTNSPTSNRPLLSAAFNVISVGRTDGSHSRGSTHVDHLYSVYRTRPDLVAPMNYTSSSTPVVGGAALLLIQLGHEAPFLSTDPVQTSITSRAGETIYNAERAEVIRAALAAGADRFTVNTTAANIVDYRLDKINRSDNGLDKRYGAGQLNIYNSYHIIAAGEQNSLEDGGNGMMETSGFDYDPQFGGADGSNNTATYTLTADEGHNLLTASLVWHVKIDGGNEDNFDQTATLYNLDLELYDTTSHAIITESCGIVDNSEHLRIALIPGHSYEIRVKPGPDQEAFSWDYALAWTTQADMDQDLIPDALDNCKATANVLQTDSDNDGYGNQCDCDLDNNGIVDAADYWRWRMLVTIDPATELWNAAVDFNENGIADADDYTIFNSRYGQIAPYE